MDRGHKIILGAVVALAGLTVAGFTGLSVQKQKLEAVPYPVYVTVTPTVLPSASLSATPTLTPRAALPVHNAVK